MTFEQICDALKSYAGRPLSFMEICGSHTAAIEKYGVRELLSDRIRLISGPGCPVCVTPSAYIDRLIELAFQEKTAVVTFADMIRVPGSRESLSDAKARGADVRMVYAPMEAVALAAADRETNYVFAAVGFETTAPIYTFMLDELIAGDIRNLKFLTAIKVMPPVVASLMEDGAAIDGFLAPGHVCAVTGSSYFAPLAEKYRVPFAVAGFEAKELVIALCGLLEMAKNGRYEVRNFYPAVVEDARNDAAFARLYRYFRYEDASWRGIGRIAGSALVLKEEYACYDAGSIGLCEDEKVHQACICGQILTGKKEPEDCPLFGTVCRIDAPQGACMVSMEGSCHNRARYTSQ